MIRQKRILFFKIEDIWFEKDRFLHGNSSIISLHSNEVLEKTEYDFKLEAFTFIVNLVPPMEEIFKNFDYKSARYPINKGTRDGVIVQKAKTKEELKDYYQFQKKFSEGKKIPVCSYQELEKMDCYYAVAADGEYLGGCAFLTSKDELLARYKYGATMHKLNANEMILWKAMCDYHEEGYQWFDMGGIIPTEDKSSYYYRHFQFKKKFGGKLVESYTYFKIRGVYRPFYYGFQIFLKLFFKGDVNGFTNFLNKIHVIH